jgi:competence protein ComEC
MRNPLILPLAAVIVGILLGHWLPFSVRESAWPIAAFLILGILAHKRLRGVCIALALVFAGTLDLALHRPLPAPEIDAGFRETVLLDGCVVEPTVFSPGREQFTLELADKARARVSLPLDDDPAPLQKLAYGQRVEIEARVRSPHNYNNPGGFDYTAYLARQNIFWTASMTRGSQATVLPGHCGSRFLGLVFTLRTAALEKLDQLYSGDPYNTG